MATETKIGWCRNSDGTAGATFNPWTGCAKISPGCSCCYAETWAKRAGKDVWGPGKPRQRTTVANWRLPLRLESDAMMRGIRQRIFCASLADVFDNEVPQKWRDDLWSLIQATPNCDWILVTKRIGNAPKMLPADWGAGYENVWLCATVVNQAEADRDIPKLLAMPAVVHGLSIEPMLGPIRLSSTVVGRYLGLPIHQHPETGEWHQYGRSSPHLDWIIIGGESGKAGRSMDIAWVRDLLRQTRAAGVATYVKQLGNNPAWSPYGTPRSYRVTGKGDNPAEWLDDIRVQELL